MSTAPAILTIVTDWHNDDFYTGMLLGRLLQVAPNLRVVSISHRIALHNHVQAAFVMRSCYRSFAPGTAHLCMVGSDTHPSRQMLLFELHGHTFIVPDNGMMGLLADTPPERVYAIAMPEEGSFAALDCVVGAIGAIARGGAIHALPTADRFVRSTRIEPARDGHHIRGSVIYIDSYGNAITNLSRELVEQIGQGRPFDIIALRYSQRVLLERSYHRAEEGELIALFNSMGLLEIAVKLASYATGHSISVGESVSVRFLNNDLELK
ncbi:MAG: SAM-dependent chlorinase/fluorinase [Bacteroidales bacterium]|nr:SAM-dependent chlorinase/fluorinase [Bacteroidales bacterium]